MSAPRAVEFVRASFAYASCAEAVSVRGVDLNVDRGECVVVTGPSGCGKTTLARMVNGLVPAVFSGEETGDVLVEGKSVFEWEMDDLSCTVGSVFQNPRSQFFNLDTTSEIAFGCENMGVAREQIALRIEEAADVLGVRHLLERDIRALSGGEKQLVAVASVYAMHPSVFVLDEPTAALDVHAMLRLREVVGRLKEAGKTVLVAEHRLWWLSGLADRVVLMREGEIAADMRACEFACMPDVDRAAMGLRAWSIADVAPSCCGDACAACDEPTGAVAPSRGFGSDVRREALASKDAQTRGLRAALSARGLCARYGKRGRLVVDGCDFDAHAGRAVALIGRNGAGKTTLARCLAGLHAECAGEVLIDGGAVSPRKRAGRVFLGMQESGYQLFSDTVEGELRLALGARGMPSDDGAADALVEEKLADFGLERYRDRHPLSLSGGQRQRLALAAGFLQGACVMVLDEPTSGLDLANMRRIAAEVERLKRDGVCLVIVTHDFEFACATCDEVAFMKDGRIAEHFELSSETASHARTLFGFER